MNANDVMRELEKMGTEQNRKVYKRHGAGENLFGVSFANLGALKKKIKTDHALAVDLWATGNGDARVLATMIADPAAADAKLLEAWAKDLEYYVLADCLARYLLANHPNAQKFMEKWTRSKDEWIGRAGWMTLAVIAGTLDEPDAYFDGYLQTIEKKIHGSKNRVKDAMIRALIAIALRGDKLEKKAVAAAKAIGKVDVDHGETHCVTPDPIPYIAKAKKRKKK